MISLIVRLHTIESRGKSEKTSFLFVKVCCLGLVLVKTKFHTFALEKFLSAQTEMTKNQIRVGRLTGQGSNEELSLSSNQQATVLEHFRSGNFQIKKDKKIEIESFQ